MAGSNLSRLPPGRSLFEATQRIGGSGSISEVCRSPRRPRKLSDRFLGPPWSCPSLWLQGDNGKARAAYQDFLTLWKNADTDILVLKAGQSGVCEVAVGLLTEQADPRCNPDLSGVGSLQPYPSFSSTKFVRHGPISTRHRIRLAGGGEPTCPRTTRQSFGASMTKFGINEG
jgi:hypothetical protein